MGENLSSERFPPIKAANCIINTGLTVSVGGRIDCVEAFEEFFGVFSVGFLEALIVFTNVLEVGVEVSFLVSLDNDAGDIGTVVGDTFEVCENVLEDIAEFDSTFVVLEAADMAVFEFGGEVIDDFFEWFYHTCNGEVVGSVSFKGFGDIFGNSVGEYLYLGAAFLGEHDAFIVAFLSGFYEVYGVVGNSLEVADAVHHFSDSAAVSTGDAAL